MPQLRCPCGFMHDLSPIADASWVTFRDADYDRIIAAERSPEPEQVIAPLLGRLYECPECRRLLWSRPGDDEYRAYAPEDRAV